MCKGKGEKNHAYSTILCSLIYNRGHWVIWFTETKKLQQAMIYTHLPLFLKIHKGGILHKFAASPRKLFSNAERCEHHYIESRIFWNFSLVKLLYSSRCPSSILRHYFPTFFNLQAQKNLGVYIILHKS